MTAQSDVDAVIGSAAAPEAEFRSSVASWAMDGKTPTVEEMQAGVELAAGRTDLAAARARLGV